MVGRSAGRESERRIETQRALSISPAKSPSFSPMILTRRVVGKALRRKNASPKAVARASAMKSSSFESEETLKETGTQTSSIGDEVLLIGKGGDPAGDRGRRHRAWQGADEADGCADASLVVASLLAAILAAGWPLAGETLCPAHVNMPTSFSESPKQRNSSGAMPSAAAIAASASLLLSGRNMKTVSMSPSGTANALSPASGAATESTACTRIRRVAPTAETAEASASSWERIAGECLVF